MINISGGPRDCPIGCLYKLRRYYYVPLNCIFVRFGLKRKSLVIQQQIENFPMDGIPVRWKQYVHIHHLDNAVFPITSLDLRS